MNDVVKMGKCGCVSPAIWLVQGDTRSHILTIRVPRMESGVDLKDLAWKINITNEAGVDDVDVPVMGSVVIDERTIAFDWLIHGVATDVPGKTTFSVVGVDETEDGKPIIWRSSPAMIYIREKHDAIPSEEVETELGELEKMIVYVNGELANVIAAGEMARSAATHPPIIGENGNWFLWDIEKEIYVDGGKNAQGPQGEKGEDADTFIVKIGAKNVPDKTYAEIMEAYLANRTCICTGADGHVFLLRALRSDDDGEHFLFIAPSEYVSGTGLDYHKIRIYKDNSVIHNGITARTPNPKKLKFVDENGEVKAEYDGTVEETFPYPKDGEDGKSAYEIAKDNGFEGTEEEWLESLKAKEEGGGGAERFYVNARYNIRLNIGINHFEIDKTPEEMLNAYNTGMEVYLKFSEITLDSPQYPEMSAKIYVPLIGVNYSSEEHYMLYFAGTITNTAMVMAHIGRSYGAEQRAFNRLTIATVEAIPKALPNPWPLSFKGGAYGTYKGNEGDPTVIHIPNTWRELEGKPFGALSEGGAVLSETELQFDDNGFAYITNAFRLYAGETYIVKGEGMEIECVAKRIESGNTGCVAIGNVEMSEDWEIPFIIAYYESGIMFGNIYGIAQSPLLKNTTTTVSIECKRIIEPIPHELINYGEANKDKLIRVKDDGTLEPFAVGKGLKMDGDALNVDEGEYELIEAITIGEDGIGRVQISDYELKEVLITVFIPQAESNNILACQADYGNRLGLYTSISNAQSTGGDRYTKIKYSCNKGSIETITQQPAAKDTNTGPVGSFGMLTGAEKIITIHVYMGSSKAFPVNSWIKIEGVRYNA